MAEVVESWIDRHHFLLRRLHSLTGVIPVGAFLFEHLLTNSLAWWPHKFNAQVHWLHELHYLLGLELLFILLPLAFHGIYGVAIVLSAKSNVMAYPYLDNWRFALQRWTGVVVAVFLVVFHLPHFRFAHWFGGQQYVGALDPFELTRRGFHSVLPSGLWYAIYAVGMTAAVFHLANGIVTFCITWGITIGEQARRKMSLLAGVLGLVLLIWGVMSLVGLGRHGPDRRAERPAAAQQLAPGGPGG